MASLLGRAARSLVLLLLVVVSAVLMSSSVVVCDAARVDKGFHNPALNTASGALIPNHQACTGPSCGERGKPYTPGKCDRPYGCPGGGGNPYYGGRGYPRVPAGGDVPASHTPDAANGGTARP